MNSAQRLHVRRTLFVSIAAGCAALAFACGGDVFTTGDGGSDGSDGSGGSDTDGGSSGGNGSGGSDATGGSGTSTGGGPSDECASGSIVFRVASAPSKAHCSPGCTEPHWLSIATPTGKKLVVHSRCTPDCAKCEDVGCSGVCELSARVSNPLEFEWDGSQYTASSCGNSNLACNEVGCTAAGTYMATFCLSRQKEDTNVDPIECVHTTEADCESVEFDWPPPAGTVVSVELGD